MSDDAPPFDLENGGDLDVNILRQALPYMREHRGKTMVVKLGGHLVKDRVALDHVAADIALLEHIGAHVCVVHGGGPQATELQERLGVEPQFVEGRRITDDATLEVVKMVFAGKINLEMIGALRGHGLRAVGLTGLSGGLIRARRREVREMKDSVTGQTRAVDFGHVGDILDVDTSVVRVLMENGFLPVVASLGADDRGNILNINADTVAVEMALDLRADKFLNMTQVPGVLRNVADPDSLITDLTVEQAEALVKEGVVRGGMIPKVRTCVEAVRRGIPRAHILNGLEAHAILLELFTVKGTGTMITASPSPPAPPAA